MAIITQKYDIKKKLGGGTSGEVYLAYNRENGQQVAIKNMELEPGGVTSDQLREIGILKKLQHKNIVSLLDVCVDKEQSEKKLHVVMEYIEIDLRKLINNNNTKQTSEEEESIIKSRIKEILYQILEGVAYSHSLGYIHRDLKLQNILYDQKSNIVKIADFGLAREYDFARASYTPEVVTLNYRAPEILLGSDQYSFPVDIWSIGCLFGEMARDGILMFPNDSKCEIAQLDRIFRTMGTPNSSLWPELASLPEYKSYKGKKCPPMDLKTLVDDLEPAGISLLTEMLSLDPSNRITAQRALEHEYFQGFVPPP